MSQFIYDEAIDTDSNNSEEDEEKEEEEGNAQESCFIDDDTFFNDQAPSNYRLDDIVLDINLDTFECKMHLVNDLLYEKKNVFAFV